MNRSTLSGSIGASFAGQYDFNVFAAQNQYVRLNIHVASLGIYQPKYSHP